MSESQHRWSQFVRGMTFFSKVTVGKWRSNKGLGEQIWAVCDWRQCIRLMIKVKDNTVDFKEVTNVGKDLFFWRKLFQNLDQHACTGRKVLGPLCGFEKSINFRTWMFQRSGIKKWSLYLNSFKVNRKLHLQASVHWIKNCMDQFLSDLPSQQKTFFLLWVCLLGKFSSQKETSM